MYFKIKCGSSFLPVCEFYNFHFLVPCYCDGKTFFIQLLCSSAYKDLFCSGTNSTLSDVLWVLERMCTLRVLDDGRCVCHSDQFSLQCCLTLSHYLCLDNLCPFESGALKALSSCVSVSIVPGMISPLLHIFRHIHCYRLLMKHPFHCVMVFVLCYISLFT